jgi:soluble lytic murein transglycosylase-like protein
MIPCDGFGRQIGIEQEILAAIQASRSERSQQSAEKTWELHQALSHTAEPLEKSLVALSLGVRHEDTSPSNALQFLSQAALLGANEPTLMTIVNYWKGRAQFRSGFTAEAIETAKSVLAAEPSIGWEKLAYELLIDALSSAKRNEELLEAWSKYAKRFSPGRRQQEVIKFAAEAMGAGGDQKRLTEALLELAATWPVDDTARWAFSRLIQKSCVLGPERMYWSRDFLLRISRNATLESGVREFVIGQLEMPLELEDGTRRVLDPFEKVDFMLRARFYEEAVVAAEDLIDGDAAFNDPGMARARGLLLLGRSYAALNQHQLAIRQYSAFLEEFPQMLDIFRARELMADSLARLGLHREAGEQYALAAHSGKADEVVRWHHFWNVWKSGDNDAALELLNRPGYVPPRDRTDLSGLSFWRARILERAGKTPEAVAAYEQILANDGDSIYAMLVVSRLGRDIPRPEDRKPDDSPGMAAKILRLDDDQEGELPQELKLVDGLRRVGLYDAARTQLRGIQWSRYSDDESWASLGRTARGVNDYRPLVQTAYRRGSALKQKPTSIVELRDHQMRFNAEWRLYFPVAFAEVTERMSHIAGIDPFFALSIMRAESRYNVDALSPVGAMGLMQIMPYTGVRLAQRLGDNGFEATSLRQPETNIGYGTYYLRILSDYYGGNIIPAIAAYNAGPAMVDHWLESCKDCSVDEFIEFIPFRETRRYVKSVLRNMNVYKLVYENRTVLDQIKTLPRTLPVDEEMF